MLTVPMLFNGFRDLHSCDPNSNSKTTTVASCHRVLSLPSTKNLRRTSRIVLVMVQFSSSAGPIEARLPRLTVEVALVLPILVFVSLIGGRTATAPIWTYSRVAATGSLVIPRVLLLMLTEVIPIVPLVILIVPLVIPIVPLVILVVRRITLAVAVMGILVTPTGRRKSAGAAVVTPLAMRVKAVRPARLPIILRSMGPAKAAWLV
jgi:hypothetical protein